VKPKASAAFGMAMQEAQQALGEQRPDKAEAAFRRALAAAPREAAAWAGLGHSLVLQGREPEALAALGSAAEHALRMKAGASRVTALLDIAFEMQEALGVAAALSLIERVLEGAPANPRAHHLRARACLRLGRLDEASRSAQKAAALAPDAVNVLLLLSEVELALGRHTAARDRLLPIAQRAGEPARIRALHLLGRAHDAAGEHEQAFACVAHAGRLMRDGAEGSALQESADALGRSLRMDLEVCDSRFFAEWRDQAPGSSSGELIFMLGYLRSGTTLLEQVLNAHPRIVVTNEAALLPSVIKELARMSGRSGHWTEQLAEVGPPGVARLRQCYWQAAEQRFGRLPAGHVLLDKTAMNTINAALINVLFPSARVLFAARDPRDVCVSCFMQSFDLTATTMHWLDWETGVRAYAEVMAYWRAMRTRLTLKIEPVRYERLVADLPGTLQPVFARLGLEWSDECVHFQTTRRSQDIRTPSFLQVSQPLYSSSIGRWRRYPAQIARVQALLEPTLADLGYR